MKVLFLELEITNKTIDIEEWFPLLEENLGHRLPDYFQLEGGCYPLADGTMFRWPGPHYYMCIPSQRVYWLSSYGKIIGKGIEKEVDDSTVNEDYEISYWGPGCDPSLRKKYKKE